MLSIPSNIVHTSLYASHTFKHCTHFLVCCPYLQTLYIFPYMLATPSNTCTHFLVCLPHIQTLHTLTCMLATPSNIIHTSLYAGHTIKHCTHFLICWLWHNLSYILHICWPHIQTLYTPLCMLVAPSNIVHPHLYVVQTFQNCMQSIIKLPHLQTLYTFLYMLATPSNICMHFLICWPQLQTFVHISLYAGHSFKHLYTFRYMLATASNICTHFVICWLQLQTFVHISLYANHTFKYCTQSLKCWPHLQTSYTLPYMLAAPSNIVYTYMLASP